MRVLFINGADEFISGDLSLPKGIHYIPIQDQPRGSTGSST